MSSEESTDASEVDVQEEANPPAGARSARAPSAERYEPIHDASVYDSPFDPLDENDAHGLVIRFTGENRRVLELGCATGSTTKVLVDRGCQVVGIELDAEAAQIAEQFAERVIVADLDLLDFDEALGDEMFDVILAADVLEHLRNPRRVMMACIEHLRPEGQVVLSIPNIAHGDARLALLRGDFDYQPYGLFDETHMRFFTRRTLTSFLEDCGLVALEWSRTQRPLGETEIDWRPPQVDALLEWVAGQPDADTYQFVIRAAAAPEGSHLRELNSRLQQLGQVTADNDRLQSRIEELTAHIEGLNARIADQEVEVLHATERERQAAARIDELQATIDVQHNRHAAELASVRAEVAKLERQLKHTAEELHEVTMELHGVSTERDQYRSSFEALVGVQEELIALRRSETFRLGRALVAPAVTGRRIARAWHRSKS
jgi:2-polyprenyl-3-methyl-5-hydroxy-6-metoxy-1,4-benzoquinol methylase